MESHSKAKTARGKRILESREPQVNEGPKMAIFMKAAKCGAVSSQALADLYSLKKPHAMMLQKKNTILPFEGGENEASLDFLSQKNNSAFAILASQSKKRPASLVLVRYFDNHVMDLCELGIVAYKSIQEIRGPTCGVGSKPAFLFQGPLFEHRHEYKQLQLILLDLFRGEVVEYLHLAGLETVISVTALEDRLLFRVYRISLKKTETGTPHVELQLMGPSLDLVMGRTRFASADLMRQALKQPKEIKPKKEKNITTTAIGETFGRVHMGDQKLDKLQTRKLKAFKKARTSSE